MVMFTFLWKFKIGAGICTFSILVDGGVDLVPLPCSIGTGVPYMNCARVTSSNVMPQF